jgi:ornithine cyclodeaminase/alanine dehydrogenase-like protein (mu-crystallin family)
MNAASVPRMVSADQLRACIGFEDLVAPVREAFRASSAGKADNGLIVMFPSRPKESGDVYEKTGTLEGHAVYVVKVSPWFAANAQKSSAQGGFLAVFDSRTGHTLAILNEEHYLSDIRTAAAGTVAAQTLAPVGTRTATVLGSGVHAYWQCLALYRARPFEKLWIWARNVDKAVALGNRLASQLSRPAIEVERDLERAVRKADVLVCATSARVPLARGDWLRAGQHLTAVGADDPTKCELDIAALRRGRVLVDSLETSSANGDVYRAMQSGGYAPGELAGEIGHVLAGSRAGRTSDADITICKLVGIGAQDLVAAETALAMLDKMAVAP